jgi:hypothetical protein
VHVRSNAIILLMFRLLLLLLLLMMLPLLLLLFRLLLLLLLLSRANHKCNPQHTLCTLLLQQKRRSCDGTNLFWVAIKRIEQLAI